MVRKGNRSTQQVEQDEDIPILKAVLSNPLIGVFEILVKDSDSFSFSYANDRYKQLLNLNEQSIVDQSIFDLINDQDASVMVSNFKRCIHLGKPLTYDEVLFLPQGRIWWQVHLVPSFTEDGQVEKLYGTVTDLTDQRRIENALLEAERKNRALISSMPDAIFRISKDGVFLDLEEGKDTILGLAPVQFLGRRIEEALPEEAAAVAHKNLIKALHTKKTQVFTYELEVDNTVHDFEVRIVAVNSEEVLAIIRDVSSAKQVERELRLAKEEAEIANKSKSAFLATVSHELRTPLNAILGFSDVIRNQMFGSIGGSKYLDYAHDIYKSGAQLLDIINDIIDLSKLESSAAELQEIVFDVNKMVQSSIKVLDSQLERSNLSLDLRLAEDMPHLYADKRSFKQIMMNVLSNAIKFTTEGGRITIETRKEISGAVSVVISDTGIGMDQEEIPRAFVPFEQIQCSIRRNYQGTGLGLALVKSLMDLHGGVVDVKSRKGVGTSVILRFPLNRSVEEDSQVEELMLSEEIESQEPISKVAISGEQ